MEGLPSTNERATAFAPYWYVDDKTECTIEVANLHDHPLQLVLVLDLRNGHTVEPGPITIPSQETVRLDLNEMPSLESLRRRERGSTVHRWGDGSTQRSLLGLAQLRVISPDVATAEAFAARVIVASREVGIEAQVNFEQVPLSEGENSSSRLMSYPDPIGLRYRMILLLMTQGRLREALELALAPIEWDHNPPPPPPPPAKEDGYTRDLDPTLRNPERGMYFSDYPGEEKLPDGTPDPRRLHHTIVSEWLHLDEVCGDMLVWDRANPGNSSQVLQDYADDVLKYARAQGVKVLFRPRYDRKAKPGKVSKACTENGNPSGTPVFHAETIELQENHIDQVAAMLGDYKDVIAFIQAGYLGNWGEWNTAGKDDDVNETPYGPVNAPFLHNKEMRLRVMRRILTAYTANGIEHSVEFRRPVFAAEAIALKTGVSVGIYNDCFMTNDHDYGTYRNLTPPEFDEGSSQNHPSTVDSVIIRHWKGFTASITSSASFGGETCPTNGSDGFSNYGERWRNCDVMVDDAGDPATMHMCYLNGDYLGDQCRPSENPPPCAVNEDLVTGAVTHWEENGCYDEIQTKLGYRFEVLKVEYTPSVRAGELFEVLVTIKNTGWARMHRPRCAALVLQAGLNRSEFNMEWGAVQVWAPGEWETTLRVHDLAPVEPDRYAVRLWIPDPDAEVVTAYAVKLASKLNSEELFNPATGDNSLFVWIDVREP